MKEIIFALPPSTENTAELYDYYKKSGCKIKIYDYSSFQTAGKKRQLREFEIEDLLFRKPIKIYDLAKNMKDFITCTKRHVPKDLEQKQNAVSC